MAATLTCKYNKQVENFQARKKTDGMVNSINSLPVLRSPNQCAALKWDSSSLSLRPFSGSSMKDGLLAWWTLSPADGWDPDKEQGGRSD